MSMASPMLKNEEWGDEEWMSTINVAPSPHPEECVSAPMKEQLKGAIDEILAELLQTEKKVRIYNKELDPEFWKNEQLDPQVRAALLKLGEDFWKDIELKTNYQDILLLGSSANYNWTPESDVDLHILVDSATLGMQPEPAQKMFRSIVGKWNIEHDVEVKGHKVEIYLQDTHETNAAESIFSLLHNQWVKKPVYTTPKVDKGAIQKKYSMWVDKIHDALQQKDENKLRKILDDLRDARKAGLQKSGELSTENLVFKILRMRGFLEKIKDGYTKFYDKDMSLPEGTSDKDDERFVRGNRFFRIKDDDDPADVSDKYSMLRSYLVSVINDLRLIDRSKPEDFPMFKHLPPLTKEEAIEHTKRWLRYVDDIIASIHRDKFSEVKKPNDEPEGTGRFDAFYHMVNPHYEDEYDRRSVYRMFHALRSQIKAGYDPKSMFVLRSHPGITPDEALKLLDKWIATFQKRYHYPDDPNDMEELPQDLPEAFDPTSVGPNPEATVGQTNGGFYKGKISQMRTMGENPALDVLRSKYPNYPDTENFPEMDQYTLDKLQALREKAYDFYRAARAAHNESDLNVSKFLLFRTDKAVKRRQALFEVFSSGEPNSPATNYLASIFKELPEIEIAAKHLARVGQIPDSSKVTNKDTLKSYLKVYGKDALQKAATEYSDLINNFNQSYVKDGPELAYYRYGKKLKDAFALFYNMQVYVASQNLTRQPHFGVDFGINEVGEKDLRQTLPALSLSDNPEVGDPKFDRSLWDKQEPQGSFKLDRLTMDELNALRTKAARSIAAMKGKETNPDELKREMMDYVRYSYEIKRRLKAINKPAFNEIGEPESHTPAENFLIQHGAKTEDEDEPQVVHLAKQIMAPDSSAPQDKRQLTRRLQAQGHKQFNDALVALKDLMAAFDSTGYERGQEYAEREVGPKLLKAHEVVRKLGVFLKAQAKNAAKSLIFNPGRNESLNENGGGGCGGGTAFIGGYGDGKRKEDRLAIHKKGEPIRRWQIRSKDAPKTPLMPGMKRNVTEITDREKLLQKWGFNYWDLKKILDDAGGDVKMAAATATAMVLTHRKINDIQKSWPAMKAFLGLILSRRLNDKRLLYFDMFEKEFTDMAAQRTIQREYQEMIAEALATTIPLEEPAS